MQSKLTFLYIYYSVLLSLEYDLYYRNILINGIKLTHQQHNGCHVCSNICFLLNHNSFQDFKWGSCCSVFDFLYRVLCVVFLSFVYVLSFYLLQVSIAVLDRRTPTKKMTNALYTNI